MKSFEINGVKEFMNELLCKDTFDRFQMAEASIVSLSSMVLDGHVTEDYLSEAERQEMGLLHASCVPYGRMRGICFSFIKGKHTPKSFRIVLLADEVMTDRLLAAGHYALQKEEIGNLSLTIRFYEGKLALVTGCALKTFSLDKSLEGAWDTYIRDFLLAKNLI